ncbi:MAG: GntR family transcriptional regulator [Clostridia bacterium]
MANLASLYVRISEYYKDMIIRKELAPGAKMPTEDEICKAFDTSRITARHALDVLANNGLIVKIQGKGTFVNKKKADLGLNILSGFSEEMKQKGKTPSTILLGINLIKATEIVAEGLNISVDSQVYSLERVRCADGIPVAYEKVYLSFSMFPDIVKNDLTGSLYTVLQQQYNITVSYAEQTLEAGLANQKLAELLSVAVGSPVLNITRSTFNTSGEPFEYVLSVYRSDMYTFKVTMRK